MIRNKIKRGAKMCKDAFWRLFFALIDSLSRIVTIRLFEA